MLKRVVLIATALMLQACDKAAFDPGAPKLPAGNIPSAIHSKLYVSSPNYANGMSPAEITIELKNDDGKPVVGVSVSIKASGDNNVMTACPPSDERGVIRCRLYSTKAEVKNIIVSGGIALEQQADFLQVAPYKSSFAVVSAGANVNAPTGHRFVISAGNIMDPAELRNSNGIVRAQTTILGQILGE